MLTVPKVKNLSCWRILCSVFIDIRFLQFTHFMRSSFAVCLPTHLPLLLSLSDLMICTVSFGIILNLFSCFASWPICTRSAVSYLNLDVCVACLAWLVWTPCTSVPLCCAVIFTTLHIYYYPNVICLVIPIMSIMSFVVPIWQILLRLLIYPVH